ncbi:MAG: L-seryl-tRNA(Sec) selenium transferase [Burkholderiaceae bacterium]|nr:L-seryl-tRNA(Sec) selenium transferase [Burkholderiaceae bacterium]
MGETGADDLQLATLPSVDALLNHPELQAAVAKHGRGLVKRAIQRALAAIRKSLAAAGNEAGIARERLMRLIARQVDTDSLPALRRVINLTGTVIHTNLGRSPLPDAAVAALVAAARHPVTIEYDLASGERGERDHITEQLLCELTGAEAATVVNNNAAAVLLVLAALGSGREVPISRGELIEIGGSFRIPDIMAMAGCRLVEVGTTNRTHLRDYENAIGEQTAMLTRIHASNYAIVGFTKAASEQELGALAKARNLPFFVDLGSGALLPFERYGLPHEQLPQESLRAGATVVSISGDKLLGGPQAGIILGRRDLIEKIRKHPLKRALRCDKLIVGALEATLRVYRDHLDDPGHLAQTLPLLRLLTRPADAIRACGERVLDAAQQAFAPHAAVTLQASRSQIGSGSLPIDRLDSWSLVITPAGRRSGQATAAVVAALRQLPLPVIGRVKEGAVWLDLRTLENDEEFRAQLKHLALPALA